MCKPDTLIPKTGIITNIYKETPDVKTFRVTTPSGGVAFPHMPGQCAMLSIPGVGEAMFSIASSPTNQEYMDFSIKQAGVLTDWLHLAETNQQLTIRGPYGKAFPVEEDLKGKDLLFIAGGIGIAPLRSVINYVRDRRSNYGTVDIVYGARSSENLVYKKEMDNEWPKTGDINIHITIDQAEENWTGNVGFVPNFVKSLGFSPDRTTIICGPPIMIKFTLNALEELDFDLKRTFTTLEMRMKCGIGKCGRCNVGKKYVCIDGPVFRCDELSELPDEY
ncbi:MAG: FAD/NAD(P)-binding protein [Oscillospiraceae bacterium]|nr:FAD/NAD(P)-binding protein [Oscillospiraceae bacterium]MCL2249974.1 FAD/NAD(P)-binding protein [Oscillospiraceae bacterium]